MNNIVKQKLIINDQCIDNYKSDSIRGIMGFEKNNDKQIDNIENDKQINNIENDKQIDNIENDKQIDNIENDKQIAEYILNRILKGYIFFLGDDEIVKLLEQHRTKFERTNMKVNLRKYNTESKLYFLKKDEKLKKFSSDIWRSAGANWETLFGFYFQKDNYIKVHVYFIGKLFDLDKLSEMVYSLFTDSKNYIKISKVKVLTKKYD